MGLLRRGMAKSGFLQTLNAQQEAELEKLAEKVKDVPFLKDHPDGDAYLLRFLRATMEKKNSDRIFHTDNWGGNEGAYERIMETVEFYKKWNLDSPPAKFEEFKKLRPQRSWFDEKMNKLVVCEKSALFHSHTSPKALTEDEWTACIAYNVEQYERTAREERKNRGLDDGPMLVGLQDVSGLSLGVRKMRPIFTINNSILSKHHPEALAKAYVINAPWIFEKMFQVIKQVVDPNTIAKVEVVTKNSKLKEVFDAKELPQEYGGEGGNAPIPLQAQGKKDVEVSEEELEKMLAEKQI